MWAKVGKSRCFDSGRRPLNTALVDMIVVVARVVVIVVVSVGGGAVVMVMSVVVDGLMV